MIDIELLLTHHREGKLKNKAVKLQFSGVADQDVYNITAPFSIGDREVIAGRIEARTNEVAQIGLFEEVEENKWNLIEGAIKLTLQDPFVTTIDGTIILGGVEVFFDKEGARWRTILYRLKSINEAEKIFEGPFGMKDIRLKQLSDGKILVLTRPQGEKGGRGKIGIAWVDTLAQLSLEIIEEATLLKQQFSDVDWGGANEIHLIDERICVLGHIASFDQVGNRHYYAMTFEIDKKKETMENPKIIAERSDFLPGPSKRNDLIDVVFSGGLVLHGKEATFYAGISDAEAQKITIQNPF